MEDIRKMRATRSVLLHELWKKYKAHTIYKLGTQKFMHIKLLVIMVLIRVQLSLVIMVLIRVYFIFSVNKNTILFSWLVFSCGIYSYNLFSIKIKDSEKFQL